MQAAVGRITHNPTLRMHRQPKPAPPAGLPTVCSMPNPAHPTLATQTIHAQRTPSDAAHLQVWVTKVGFRLRPIHATDAVAAAAQPRGAVVRHHHLRMCLGLWNAQLVARSWLQRLAAGTGCKMPQGSQLHFLPAESTTSRSALSSTASGTHLAVPFSRPQCNI